MKFMSVYSARTRWARCLGALMGGAALAAAAAAPVAAHPSYKTFKFPLVRSAAAEGAGCLAKVRAWATVTPLGPVEKLVIFAAGLPANTEFDVFVIDLPNAPFGLSWYQGDLESNARGFAEGVFIGRFNIETFIVGPGPAAAPVVHSSPPFPDASTGPQTAPVHTFHLGVWFNSPADAQKAGCPNAVTPFNGDHTAGVQALSTRTFPDDKGPLRQITP